MTGFITNVRRPRVIGFRMIGFRVVAGVAA